MLLGALLLGAAAPAQTGSPVGTTWDCILSGKRSGIAYLTFSTNGNGTLSGYEILVPQPLVSPRTVLVSDALGSNGLGVRPQATNDTINIFGCFPVSGLWGFDSKGHINGHFIEIVHDANCTSSTVPTGTNTFESQLPINQVTGGGPFSEAFCVTQPIFTNTLFTYNNQTTCYLAPVPLSTNTFPSATPYWVTNALPSGTFCVTVPIYTNLDLITFTEQMTHYMDRFPTSTNTFVSPTAITETNYLPDGTWCETVAQRPNTFADTYTLQTICWTNLAPPLDVTTNFTSTNWFGEIVTLPHGLTLPDGVTLPDGTVRVTIPIYTNNNRAHFTEQEVWWTFNIDPNNITNSYFPILTNTFVSDTPINFRTNLPNGDIVVVTNILSAVWDPTNYWEETTYYAPSTPASSSTFPSSTTYAERDINPDGVLCVTVPIYTNLTLISFNEMTICYTNHVLMDERTFVSKTAITQTNPLRCTPTPSAGPSPSR
jgi:hypothetical protein